MSAHVILAVVTKKAPAAGGRRLRQDMRLGLLLSTKLTGHLSACILAVLTISPETFAERLHLARSSRGLRQVELAEMLGIRQQQLSRYEMGTVMPRTRMLLNLATCLGVRRQWLVDGLGPAQESQAELGFQPPQVTTKVLAEGQTAISLVLPTDLRESLAARAKSDGVSLDELLVGALLALAESQSAHSKP